MEAYVLILFAQILLNWTLFGITAFVQVVHYPLFKKIKEGFVQYERENIQRNAYLVGPLMLLEAVTALFVVGMAPIGMQARLAIVNVILLVFIWLSTFLLNVYQHQRLSIRFSSKVLHELISSNWIRAILWLTKGIILLSMVWYLLTS